jgi:iron(III) transport system substrate-binding protein
MLKNVMILGTLAVIVALPFLFRKSTPAGAWRSGDPVLVIISPHNEAIRFEFSQAFSKWHEKHYGTPVKIDWRNIGGTTEIARYLSSEYASAVKPWLRSTMPDITALSTISEAVVQSAAPSDASGRAAWEAFRNTDDPAAFTIDVDLFFGGGWVDHDGARSRGQVVAPWKPGTEPAGVRESLNQIPESLAGENWRSSYVIGTAVSTFGIVYNVDRLTQLGYTPENFPKRWDDLADPRLFRQIGATDPTKSGSIAKAFELIIYSKVYERVVNELKLNDTQIDANEKQIADWAAEQTKAGNRVRRSDVPAELKAYQDTIERGWLDGVRLVQEIGANARYFTDSAGKVSIDVSMGDAAAGMSIDFFGRYQAQTSRGPAGEERMRYVNPIAGTSASCDPITLLRGSPRRELATRFIEFVISEDGQKLWTYKPGVEGGPIRYPLRRLPIRRDFYPDTDPARNASHLRHQASATDDLSDPNIDPFQIAEGFKYYPRWTGPLFTIQRDLIRAMCLDSGTELRDAWSTVRHLSPTDPKRQAFSALPTVTLTDKNGKPVEVKLWWGNAREIRSDFNALEYMREWTEAFRNQYRAATR